MTNFTVQDVSGALRAIGVFPALLVTPGYVLSWAVDLFRFRSRTLRERMAWSVALSFATAPIFTAMAGRVIGVAGVAVCAALLAAVAIALLYKQRSEFRMSRDRSLWWLAALLICGAALVVLELVDLQIGDKLALSVTVVDQGYRVGFVNAIARTGIPPTNPFYHPGEGSPLRYYYFWYGLCAVVMKLAHVSARQALIASSVWAGLGLSAMVALFLRHFLRIRQNLNRYIVTATFLLMVTGADLLPVLYNLFANNDFGGETEWWSADQVASWMDTILWVPNHTASLIACLTVFLLLWRTMENLPRRQKIAASLLAGLAGASAFGLSIYVTAALAMMIAVWALRLMLRDREFRLVVRICAAAVMALVLLIPYLHDLIGGRSGTEERSSAGPQHVLVLGVRQMIDPAVVAGLPQLAHINTLHPRLLEVIVKLLLLIPGYGLELGFFGVVLLLAFRDRRQFDQARRTAIFLAVTGLTIGAFIRSAVIGNNDFGYRSVLLPCFFLLLLGADMVRRMQDGDVPERKLRGAAIALLLLLGICGTAFQALALRSYIPYHSLRKADGFVGLGEAVLDSRKAYGEADRLVPANAVVQANPNDQESFFYVANMLFTSHQMVTDAADDCGAVFGGDPSLCASTQGALRALFKAPDVRAAQARAVCAQVGAQYLVASREDTVWHGDESWVWALPAVTGPASRNSPTGGSIRIVHCGTTP